MIDSHCKKFLLTCLNISHHSVKDRYLKSTIATGCPITLDLSAFITYTNRLGKGYGPSCMLYLFCPPFICTYIKLLQ